MHRSDPGKRIDFRKKFHCVISANIGVCLVVEQLENQVLEGNRELQYMNGDALCFQYRHPVSKLFQTDDVVVQMLIVSPPV